MAKVFKPKMATGNDLLVGDVVYFTDGAWTRVIGEAELALSAEAEADLLERASQFPNQIVGVYLTDVNVDDAGRAVPAHFREDFRMLGPSNRPEHGRSGQEA